MESNENLEANIEKIIEKDIVDDMKNSYIEYAMDVIIQRALPDVRDGMKPVHRRIMYSMHETGNFYNKPHKKSARIVGEVLGKYHPHGDSSVYEATVRMAQDFSLRYPFVDGHGNFGSVDGDSAAAMRYTEVRMSKIASEMMVDIDKNTVNMQNNYDGSLKEPSVLPAKFPCILVNGTEGIAVGMATKIPPHNITEVLNAVIALIDNENLSIDDIIKIVKGPDFPTAGFIIGKSGIVDAYKTGKGCIVTRAKTCIEEIPKSNGKMRIVVTEIPYQVNKAKLVENIADLARNKVIEDISDLRDESNRVGMRIVIELKKDANANKILNQLYKHTNLQTNFNVNMMALVPTAKGKLVPKILNLLEVIKYFLKHRVEVTQRKYNYDLEKAKAKRHIFEGLMVALSDLDKVIELIKTSKSNVEAKERLNEKYNLSDAQTQAILDMRLQKLTGLEREKIESDYNDLKVLINKIETILSSEKNILQEIKNECLDMIKNYGDERKTTILNISSEINIEEDIKPEDVVISITNTGYIKRLPLDTYKTQKKGGKGVTGLKSKTKPQEKETELDFVQHFFTANTQHLVLFFTDKGKMYKLPVFEIPEHSRVSKGSYIMNILDIPKEDKINAVLEIKNFDDENLNLLMFTKLGGIKKIALSELKTNRKCTTAIKLKNEKDELINACVANEKDDIFIATQKGMAIRFNESEVNSKGKTAGVISAIKLKNNDIAVSADIIRKDTSVLTITSNGLGKKTLEANYKLQGKNGTGTINVKLPSKSGVVVGSLVVEDTEDVILISDKGKVIRTPVAEIKAVSRSSMGSKVMNLNENEQIISITKISNESDESDELDNQE